MLVLATACGRLQVQSPSASADASAVDASHHGSTAGPWTWRNVNLQGMGYLGGIIVHPDTVHAPNLVYARTNVGGAYRWEAATETWVPLLDAFGPLRDGAYFVESVAVDPERPDDVYVVVDGQTHYTPNCNVDAGEVLVSHDRGATWTTTRGFGAYVFANDAHGDTTGERLAIDPHEPGLGYFGSHKDGLWKLSDGAWTRVQSPGLPASSCTRECTLTCDPKCSFDCFAGVTFVVFDPASGTTAGGATRRIYVGVWSSGVYASEDGGATFSVVGADPHPVRGSLGPDGTLYVSFGNPEADWQGPGGVRAFRSTGSGGWTDTDVTPPTGTGVSYSGISADAHHPGTVIVTTNSATVFRSQDSGRTWNAYPVKAASAPPWYWRTAWPGWGGALALDPNDATGLTAWRTDGFAVSRTRDVTRGAWSATMRGLEELVAAIVRAPGTAHVQLYAGVADATGFADADRTTPPPRNLTPREGGFWMATSFDFCASQPTVAAYVGWDEAAPTRAVTGITRDDGATFAPFANTTPGSGGCIAIASNDPTNFVWEPANGSQVYFTHDSGRTWRPATFVPAENAAGASFYRISTWFIGQTLASDRVTPGVFYYLSQSQGSSPVVRFWVSTDGGQTFADKGPLPGALTYTSNPMIKPNPLVAGDVWVSLGKNDQRIGRLYRSTDGGSTFRTVDTLDAVHQVAFGKGPAPTTPSVYVLGRAGGSSLDTMFRSDDLGRTWSAISDPNVQRFGLIQYLEGDMSVDGLVYVATAGRGILYGSP